MKHVSDKILEMADELNRKKDGEIQALAEVLPQYIQDHNDKAAYREVDRQVNALARAWDKMIDRLYKWGAEAAKIEASVDNFYGD